MSNYPVYLKIQNKRCLVVGGGDVARRKVRTLLNHGARVEVVSPECDEDLKQWSLTDKLRIIYDYYRSEYLDGVFLVVAATDLPAVNRRVALEAHEKHILCNIADQPELSDFFVPAVVQKGDISIAVSTAGKSPAMARKLKTFIGNLVPESYVAFTEILGALRAHPVMSEGSPEQNKILWEQLLDSSILQLLESGKLKDIEMLLSSILGREITLSELGVKLECGGSDLC